MRFDLDPTPGDATRVQMPHPEIFKALRTGMLLLLDDGRVRLRVYERDDTWADVTVDCGSNLSVRMGVVNAFDAEQPRYLGGSLLSNMDPYGTRFFVGLNYRPF